MNDPLYEIAWATNRQYLRAPNPDQALVWASRTRNDARIRVFPQEELDALVEIDPKLAGRLRRL